MTSVSVATATRTATYVATNMISSLRHIIRDCGLDQAKIQEDWQVLELGAQTWLATGHLQALVLEVWDPSAPDNLIDAFEFTIRYDGVGDGDLWLDPDTIRFATRKAGLLPSQCRYRFVATTSDGRPDVSGWSSTTRRSTSGLTRQTFGSGIGAGGTSADLTLYRRLT